MGIYPMKDFIMSLIFKENNMDKKVQEIFNKSFEEFTGDDIDYLIRSDLFKEGGLVNPDYRQEVLDEDGKPVYDESGNKVKKPARDMEAFSEIVEVSARTLHRNIINEKDITSRTYKAIMTQVHLRLKDEHLRLKDERIKELERYIAIHRLGE